MLFHSAEFLFLFLPVTLAGFYALGRLPGKIAFAWLAFASLCFYGYWNARYVALIGGSIVVNYLASRMIDELTRSGRQRATQAALAIFIIANLAVLAYFKYLMFFAEQARALTGVTWDPGIVLLPIGISFYTFTQIAFLADCAAGKVRERSFVAYALFVTYFPHLVAGPVLHHGEMMPQFAERKALRFNADYFAMGITFFAFGLFKKIVVADGCAPVANDVFTRSIVGGLSMGDAWLGSVAYMLQIYFDFSGYSDMAIGLSLMFNVKLPINFYSPYRATSIIEFWRRWHMTLSRFLRDYLYIPLGGGRKGKFRRLINLMLTMILGGLWHGANWTFVAWGALHGVFLVINHGWRVLVADIPALARPSAPIRVAYLLITLLCTLMAWVYFRAPSIASAHAIFGAMLHGAALSSQTPLNALVLLVGASAWALLAPNTNQVMRYSFGGSRVSGSMHPAHVRWAPNSWWALWVSILLIAALALGVSGRTKIEFLYFQF